MLSLAFTFPAGRYHATPWERHVNEGAVPWPPEPWRFLRALIATWHHKVRHTGHHDEKAIVGLIEALALEPPQFVLPSASHSHTRHYMPQWKAGDTSLVFDAFAAVPKEQPLYMTWQNVELPGDQLALLDDLLAVLGYLGRAESWVEATRVSAAPAPTCVPGEDSYDAETGEVLGDLVTLLVPVSAPDYQALRRSFITGAKAMKQFRTTLPESFIEALSVETSDLRRNGWSLPPAARKVNYVRPADALRPRRTVHHASPRSFDTVQYVMAGKPLPRAEDTLRIGELLRQAVMSRVRHELGETAIPPALSGHDLPQGNRHQHAFYLPWDSDGDGRLDRLLVHVPGGLAPSMARTLGSLRRLWSRDGNEWPLALEGIGNTAVASPLTASASVWQSVTPYLHPWHLKRRFTLEDQVRREFRERGLPEPTRLERLATVRVGHQVRRPIDFARFREKRGLQQPDRQGSFWRVTFGETVAGPLALGFGCHFGLGLFRPT
ncbi:MAG: type I-U CRISPR-associated protein Csb2 [Vicinamibacterales bacterium]